MVADDIIVLMSGVDVTFMAVIIVSAIIGSLVGLIIALYGRNKKHGG
jgi:hypothetical protein